MNILLHTKYIWIVPVASESYIIYLNNTTSLVEILLVEISRM